MWAIVEKYGIPLGGRIFLDEVAILRKKFEINSYVIWCYLETYGTYGVGG